MRWLAWLLKAIGVSRWRRRDGFTGAIELSPETDPAADIRRHRLVLVGRAGSAKWLRFRCPCGCGETVSLNLMASHSPRWRVERHSNGTLSVNPSVDSQTCGSHYWIRRGRVVWV